METIKTEIIVFISDQIDFKSERYRKEKGHYIMIKGLIQEEDIQLSNIYAVNTGEADHVKQMLTDIKGNEYIISRRL